MAEKYESAIEEIDEMLEKITEKKMKENYKSATKKIDKVLRELKEKKKNFEKQKIFA